MLRAKNSATYCCMTEFTKDRKTEEKRTKEQKNKKKNQYKNKTKKTGASQR